ncbi:MAG: hypothetical protein U0Y96_16415 [Candidatus Kapaibacterium sp.]
MTTQIKTYGLFYLIMIFVGCHVQADKQTSELHQELTVTIRENQKDSTFILHLAQPTERYMTELLVSDPECTECKDCFVDSGEIKIPEVLKQYVKWDKDILLACKNPYEIENTSYAKYKLKGYVTGVRKGYLIFCVTDWKRQ